MSQIPYWINHFEIFAGRIVKMLFSKEADFQAVPRGVLRGVLAPFGHCSALIEIPNKVGQENDLSIDPVASMDLTNLIMCNLIIMTATFSKIHEFNHLVVIIISTRL